MFGDSVPKPIGFLVNNWIANPFTLGSYSNMSPGFNVRHLEGIEFLYQIPPFVGLIK